jgi:hypothetical protein
MKPCDLIGGLSAFGSKILPPSSRRKEEEALFSYEILVSTYKIRRYHNTKAHNMPLHRSENLILYRISRNNAVFLRNWGEIEQDTLTVRQGRAIAQAVSRWLPTAAVRVLKPGSSHVGFVVDKVALGQVFSEYFRFPANLHSTNFSTITIDHHHLSSGAGTIGQ